MTTRLPRSARWYRVTGRKGGEACFHSLKGARTYAAIVGGVVAPYKRLSFKTVPLRTEL